MSCYTKCRMMMPLLACMLPVLITANACAETAIKKKKKKKARVEVFILAGQSNAVGFNNAAHYKGGIENFNKEFVDASTVLLWPGSNARQEFANRWTKMQTGVSEISVQAAYAYAFGPEVGFGKVMADSMTDRQIAVLKYAVGGTGIARSSDYNDYIPSLKGYNDKGLNWHYPEAGRDAGILYKNLLQNIQQAMDSLRKAYRHCAIRGFIWMQGEHEAGISQTMANDYSDLLLHFFASIRKQLNIQQLPVVIGKVNANTWAFGDLARQRQREYCATDPYCKLVTTTDLTRNGNGDTAHFDTEGMLLLGERFAAQMLVLLKKRMK
ncbi:MAG: sialate O-acetylesterase [Agriterribacter sp.]